MSVSAYPLEWPAGWRRTAAADRKNAHFGKQERQYSTIPGSNNSWMRKKDLTISDGVGRILDSLERMGISRNDVVISTNVRTRLDGLPRSGERQPDDPGAAVYWRHDYNSPMRCMAIDRYSSVADNLGAIAATLEAMRAIERHGGAEILNRTFTGFAALAATTGPRPWREVLGIMVGGDLTRSLVEAHYRTLARARHPDAGGSDAAMVELNVARDQALQEIGNA